MPSGVLGSSQTLTRLNPSAAKPRNRSASLSGDPLSAPQVAADRLAAPALDTIHLPAEQRLDRRRSLIADQVDVGDHRSGLRNLGARREQ
jgi:hypothetical protein